MTKFSVNEIFGPTIQGEGTVAGRLTYFVRLNGCDYRCAWCDSLDAVLPERIKNHTELLDKKGILKRLRDLGGDSVCDMVTISGGNPAIHKYLYDLIDALKLCGYRVALETQGSIYQSWFTYLDYLTLSPKPPSSGNTTEIKEFMEVFEKSQESLSSPWESLCVKVVVFDEEDLDYACKVYDEVMRIPVSKFYLQVGTRGKGISLEGHPTVEQMVEDYRKLVNMVLSPEWLGKMPSVHVLPQLHLYLFGHGRGV